MSWIICGRSPPWKALSRKTRGSCHVTIDGLARRTADSQAGYTGFARESRKEIYAFLAKYLK